MMGAFKFITEKSEERLPLCSSVWGVYINKTKDKTLYFSSDN